MVLADRFLLAHRKQIVEFSSDIRKVRPAFFIVSNQHGRW
jgi:hypothetical protein